MEEKKYKVTGMFCAACQAHVQKAAQKVDGVEKAEVSLLTNSLEVTFLGKANDKAIEKAIKNAGYGASPWLDESYKARRNERAKELRKTLIKLIIAGVLLLILMYFSMSMMTHWPTFSNMEIDVGIELGLATVILLLYGKYFVSGTKSFFQLHPTMLSLISLGSGVSYLYGVYVYIMMFVNPESLTSHDVYFEAAGMILVLVSLGKYFEALAKSKTTSSIENLLSLAPETALVEVDGIEKEIPAKELKIGDLCIVKPGARVPTDGTIVSGYGHLEEAAITGEAVPVYKKEKDPVIGSTLNTSGSFKMRVTSVGQDTTINKIVKLVEEAANSKAKLAALADRVSMVFVPIVMSIALIVFLSWGLSGHPWNLAINMGVSVLVVSCPCALGLATPVAIMVGTGKGAEHGILIKSASAFEEISSVKALVFDKTGTITTGHMSVSHLEVTTPFAGDALLSIETLSEHPLAEATVIYLSKQGYTKKEVTSFLSLPGFGVEGTIEGKKVVAGNEALFEKEKIAIPDLQIIHQDNPAKTLTFLAIEGGFAGYIALGDELKEGAKEDILALKNKGHDLYLASGDNDESASSLAKEVGIEHVYSSVKPEGKLALIDELQKKGLKVAMIGDGVNDAPALEKANVGIAIGSGTDLAIDSADIILVNSSLHDLVGATTLSKKVVANIKLNLFWAFFYNVIGIPLAAGCFYYATPSLSLNPMIASGMMALSSVCVVLNALRLKLIKLD